MKLVKFSVERYRSIIERSEFQIYDNTVIIGPNNEGKSNILRALVCALKILERFAKLQPSDLKKENKTFIYNRTILGQEENYFWVNDYPKKLQQTNGKKENKNSIFILEFQLDDKEFADFKNLTKTELKNKKIPLRLIVNDNTIKFTLNIPGHFYKTASGDKMTNIAKFITSKVYICYIDAVRTVNNAYSSISTLLSMKMKSVSESAEYKSLLKQLRELYDPSLTSLAAQLTESLQRFIPSVKSSVINVSSDSNNRFDPFNRFNVDLDDGVKTPLDQKGSGVQSLAALSLAHLISKNSNNVDNFILAVEEPEAHLHPDAIHKLRDILQDIAKNNQLIVATHSPIFVQTDDPHKNIIVTDNKASAADKIKDVREILGVHPADNLIAAELVLLVEGTADENMLPTLLCLQSTKIKAALENGRLVISSCGGTHHMENYVKFIRFNLCKLHVLVDGDEAGKQIIATMKSNNTIQDSEYFILTIPGLSQSEIENLIIPDTYAEDIISKYNVEKAKILDAENAKVKWSDYMKKIFTSEGKVWDENTEKEIKTILSEAVKRSTSLPLIYYRASIFMELCKTLERRLGESEP